MADTAIEYADKSWQLVTGCTKVSAGCRFCWAERFAPRQGINFSVVTTHPEKLDELLRWRKPRTVFVAPQGDLFHEAAPDWFLDQVFARMRAAQAHTFLVLTKRPERMAAYVGKADGETSMRVRHMFPPQLPKHWYFADNWRWPLPNVWLGVSVEDQATADERIPILLETPAAHRWVSAEPLLSSLDLRLPGTPKPDSTGDCPRCHKASYSYQRPRHGMRTCTECGHATWYGRFDYVVTAPESGPRRRYCDLDWVRSIVAQCEAAGVPCMVKHLYQDGKKVSLPELDGRRHEARP